MLVNYQQSFEKIQATAAEKSPETPVYFNQKKHQLEYLHAETGKIMQIFTLPLPFVPALPDEKLWEYALRLPPTLPPYAIAIIHAGSAALGYFEGGAPVRHKVIKKYMVRAKQGRAELLQQQIKPRHSEGSRLRLRNSYSFFEEINEKLSEWHKIHRFEHLFYHCPINFLQYWHSTKCPMPIERRSSFLKKIPTHVPTPNFETLLKINQFCLHGHTQNLQENL